MADGSNAAVNGAGFVFDNTFAAQMEGFFEPWQGVGFPEPALVKLNASLAQELGLDVPALQAGAAAAIFSGNAMPAGAAPMAQAYAGHQFGGFSPSLGDGRALLLGEVIDAHGRRRDVVLKGSGATPFSRGGDGKATLGPVLREYVIGEAMHALGIPTTRALAAVTTGEPVMRDSMLPGAVLARVASSHIRVGTFEYFAVRKEADKLRALVDYTLARHYPDHAQADNPALALLEQVSQAQAKLVARWLHVGFIHGVMNTDNVTVSGETIDYGPCAFMDAYDPRTVFSSIDRQGRYAYGNQPGITQWNLARFAEALLTQLDDDRTRAIELAHEVLDAFGHAFNDARMDGMRTKLGLREAQEDDTELAEQLLSIMEKEKADFTSVFRALAGSLRGDATAITALVGAAPDFEAWDTRWRARLEPQADELSEVADAMDRVNPVYIPRNHKTEEALSAAVDHNDLAPFEALLDAVTRPFEARASCSAYASPAPPDFGPYQTFCGT